MSERTNKLRDRASKYRARLDHARTHKVLKRDLRYQSYLSGAIRSLETTADVLEEIESRDLLVLQSRSL